jgi:hypothetical protein
MNRVILLYFDGAVNEQFELFGMRPHVLTFEKPSSFNDLSARVRAVMNVGCDVWLHMMYNMRGKTISNGTIIFDDLFSYLGRVQ